MTNVDLQTPFPQQETSYGNLHRHMLLHPVLWHRDMGNSQSVRTPMDAMDRCPCEDDDKPSRWLHQDVCQADSRTYQDVDQQRCQHHRRQGGTTQAMGSHTCVDAYA